MNEASTLADVRTSIAEDEISGVPEHYQFLFGGAPVSRRQECRRKAVDCFPFLTIIRENALIAASLIDVRPTAAEAFVPASEPEPSSMGAGSGAEPTVVSEPEVLPGGRATLELQITDGPLEGVTITVGEEGARLGRHTSNTLVIPEAGISRFHCEICFVNGEFCVKDLGSTTGTYFYLRPHSSLLMFTGLFVKLGETEMQVLSQTLQSGLGAPEQVMLFYEGPLAGHKVRIPAAGISIGRSHDNSLVLLQDSTVSAHHAMIFHEDGEFFISDLGSCNGTCVRLSNEREVSDWNPIMDGDVLGAGCTKVRCRVRIP